MARTFSSPHFSILIVFTLLNSSFRFVVDTISRCNHVRAHVQQIWVSWRKCEIMFTLSTLFVKHCKTTKATTTTMTTKEKRKWKPSEKKSNCCSKSCPFHILPEVKSLKNILLCPCSTNCQRNILSTELEDAKHEAIQNFQHCKHIKYTENKNFDDFRCTANSGGNNDLICRAKILFTYSSFFALQPTSSCLACNKNYDKTNVKSNPEEKKIYSFTLHCVRFVYVPDLETTTHTERERESKAEIDRNHHINANLLWKRKKNWRTMNACNKIEEESHTPNLLYSVCG